MFKQPMALTRDQKKQVGLAIAFAVIIIILVVVIMVKWKPDCFSTKKTVRFDDTPVVHEIPCDEDTPPDSSLDGAQAGSGYGDAEENPYDTEAIKLDRKERDEQNSKLFALRHSSGRQPSGRVPTTGTMMMAARDTRLEGGHTDNTTTLSDRLAGRA